MTQIQQTIAQWLAGQLGVAAVAGNSPVQTYPLLAVTVEQVGATLVDGGRQVERQYTVTITAAADRDREGSDGLLTQLEALLQGGIPMGDRVLHPMEISTQGDKLCFTLVLCQVVPRSSGADVDYMKVLHMDV